MDVDNMEVAIKEVIYFRTIRGKFSSVHPDLAAKEVIRVEVGREGLHFITKLVKKISPTKLLSIST